ncbi:5-methylcytosine restriction system specificity protein McrC [Geodermatophilus sp. SYSU D01105]
MLELREYETRTVALTAAQAVELARLTRGAITDSAEPRVIQQLTPSAQPGCYDVQPGPFVGRFTLRSGLTVDIASRFPFTDLLEVLRVAARHPTVLHEAPTLFRVGRGLLELIATAFARELRGIAGFGLAKGYVARTFTRPPYPGVPDATAHLARHLGRPDRLITRARRQTVDIPVNQVLAAAHRVLVHQTYEDPQLAVRLRALAPVLTGITAVADPQHLLDIARRNMPTRYREAVGLAALILAGRTTLPAGSGTGGVSVLFNMTRVWESFVQAALARSLRPGHRLSVQHPVLLSTDGTNITAAADLLEVGPDHSPVALYDAKYKPWGAKPSTDEIYQVVTYAYRLGLRTATLVYPGRGEHSEVSIGEYRVRTAGLEVLAPRLATLEA